MNNKVQLEAMEHAAEQPSKPVALDTVRLDWLMANNGDHSLKVCGGDSMGWFVYHPRTDTSSKLYRTSREAIDAARIVGQQTKGGGK